MNTALLGLLAETSIHPGSGQDTGYVDLPVAREKATHYPVVVGSSFKRALRDMFRGRKPKDENKIFGSEDTEDGGAGELLVSDLRLLLLPVRSSSSLYKWVTCPYLLERFNRDQQRCGIQTESVPLQVNKGNYLGAGKKALYLEERSFTSQLQVPSESIQVLKSLIRHEVTRKRLEDQIVILHDDDFAWFAQYGLPVNARNVLDNDTKTSKNLWYEETLPPDTLMYALLKDRTKGCGAVNAICTQFIEHPYVQVGGNATVGQGWFAVAAPIFEGAAEGAAT